VRVPGRLARRGIELPRVGLGTAALGGLFEAVDAETAASAIELAWEHGVRFFDTAPLYGLGLSERRLAGALLGRPRAEYIVLASRRALAAAALQFPPTHPAVASILLGPRSPDQLAEGLDLLELPVPATLWPELQALGLLS
jgi:aryl-alcohol dehydrogenase-like predicted oxidoreductase